MCVTICFLVWKRACGRIRSSAKVRGQDVLSEQYFGKLVDESMTESDVVNVGWDNRVVRVSIFYLMSLNSFLIAFNLEPDTLQIFTILAQICHDPRRCNNVASSVINKCFINTS